MNLILWGGLAAAFMAGFGAGAAFGFFRSTAKMSCYRHFIEDRLSRLNAPGNMSSRGESNSIGAIEAALGPGCIMAGSRVSRLDRP